MNLDKIEKLYSENIEKFGIDSQSVGWNSPESQELRFKKLCGVIDNSLDSITINELGCGYCELFKFLDEEQIGFKTFNGYDISKPMLDAAQDYIKSEKLKLFHSGKIKTQADYTITSGIFNVPFDNEKNSWEEYIKATIKMMFDQSDKGISFNFLTKYVDWEAENLYYADPSYWFDFCKKNISKYVSLIHDYNLYEFTLLVKK